MSSSKSKSRGKGKSSLASQADRHRLYELSVQSPPDEVEMIEGFFRELRSREPELMREDFCGTAALACEWANSDPIRRAVGLDISAEVLDWGREHNLSKLDKDARSRVSLVQGDVMAGHPAPADMICAFNFSYWIFKTRPALTAYFARVREGLVSDGVFLMDVFGGSESMSVMKEKTKQKRFTYVWDQASYDPISADFLTHIHFHFPDGSRMKKAFTYDWRLWTLAEIGELLREAGFSHVQVFWEQTGEDGEGNGEYEAVDVGDPDPAWIAYVAAMP